MIGAAAVGLLQVSPAHGEHGGTAVAAFQETGIHIVVFFLPPVVGGGATLPEGPGGGEGAVVQDGLVVVLDDDVFVLILAHVFAVDLLPGVFALAQGADIKIVVQNALHCDDGPGGLDGTAAVLPGSQLPFSLRHAGGGDAFAGEIVGDFFIAPAVNVKLINPADNVRFGGDDFKFLAFVYNVAVGGSTDPFAVLLAALDHRLDLFAGVGDGHLVDEKLELDFQPVVVVGEVDVVPDGDDADAGVPQVLQLHQAAAVAAGEAGEVLDDEDIFAVGHQLPAHGLVTLPLLEGVTGAVPVLEEGEGAVGELLPDERFNDGFLVFDGGVVPVQFFVYGDAAVAGDGKVFNHLRSSVWCDVILYEF